MGIIRQCNTNIIKSCIVGAIKGVVEITTFEKKSTLNIDEIAEEIVNFGLVGISAKT